MTIEGNGKLMIVKDIGDILIKFIEDIRVISIEWNIFKDNKIGIWRFEN